MASHQPIPKVVPVTLPTDARTDAADTAQVLLDTAMALYADRGVFHVSLAEIVREAGQRNASAVHYHFGGRDQMLYAMLEPTVLWLDGRRRELLEDARSSQGDPRPVVEVIVRPLVELAGQGWRERAWMKIGLELVGSFDRLDPSIEELLQRAGGTEALAVLQPRCRPLPPDIWAMRTNTCIDFAGTAAVQRARAIDEGRAPSVSDEAFVQNLIDMFVGAVDAPLTAPRD